MQAFGSRRRHKKSKRSHTSIGITSSNNNNNASSLEKNKERSWRNFYKETPSGDITLDNFEYCSYQRLVYDSFLHHVTFNGAKSSQLPLSNIPMNSSSSPTPVLRQIDQWTARGIPHDKLTENIREKSTELYGSSSNFDYETDSTSHHILRLAHCKTEALRRWFVQQESALLSQRLKTLSREEYTQMLKDLGLPVYECSTREKEEKKVILKTLFSWDYKKTENVHPSIYKVRFEMVLSLVRTREVYLEGGMAYVPHSKITTIIMQRFRTELMEKLEQLERVWTKVEQIESDRLVPFLNRVANKSILLTNKQAASSFTDTGDEVLPEHLDMLKKESYPLCMKALHNKLRETHHLKHFGRMQYGLFLKGIGLSLQNALAFWSGEFTNNMSHQKFEQGYAYNIRHNYGKEGKGQSYAPYGCHKIITTNSEDCVCPFKHYDKKHLSKLLKSEAPHLTQQNIEEIHNLNAAKHYQVSCRQFFEWTHPVESKWPKDLQEEDDGAPFLHPNRYYKTSRRILAHVKQQEGDDETVDAMDTTE